MNMTKHHTQLNNPYIVSFSDLMLTIFTKLVISSPSKYIVSILGTPLKVVKILTFAITTAD